MRKLRVDRRAVPLRGSYAVTEGVARDARGFLWWEWRSGEEAVFPPRLYICTCRGFVAENLRRARHRVQTSSTTTAADVARATRAPSAGLASKSSQSVRRIDGAVCSAVLHCAKTRTLLVDAPCACDDVLFTAPTCASSSSSSRGRAPAGDLVGSVRYRSVAARSRWRNDTSRESNTQLLRMASASGNSPRRNQDQTAPALPLGLHTIVHHPSLAMR